jgi:hypothetical protein
VLNGLAIQALTSEAALEGDQIREEVIRTLFPDGPRADGRSAKRAGTGPSRLPVGG